MLLKSHYISSDAQVTARPNFAKSVVKIQTDRKSDMNKWENYPVEHSLLSAVTIEAQSVLTSRFMTMKERQEKRIKYSRSEEEVCKL